MAAGQRRPEHAIAVDVASARPVTRERWFIDLGERGVWWIGSRSKANDIAREAERRAPNRPVHRVDADAVKRRRHALVLRRMYRLLRLDIIIPLTIAVGVEDKRSPALRLLFVPCLFEYFAIEPSDDTARRSTGAGPQRVAGILSEHEMMRLEARAY